jgi:deoxycytidine triphosphate deaminase
MILTGQQIASEVALQRITIDPFLTTNVNPNSYNFRVGNSLRVYQDRVIDPRTRPATELMTMPESGFVLEAQHLYLASTMEIMGSDHYAPTFAARSSVARLGLFINLSASLGDIGYLGQWTLQLFSAMNLLIYPGMEIGQIMWWKPLGPIDLYRGKYQGSSGPCATRIHHDFSAS